MLFGFFENYAAEKCEGRQKKRQLRRTGANRITWTTRKDSREQCRLYDFTRGRDWSSGRNAVLPCAVGNKRGDGERDSAFVLQLNVCRPSVAHARAGTVMKTRKHEGRRSKDRHAG
jgi:hypothetical protein